VHSLYSILHVVELQDPVAQIGGDMAVRDLTDTESAEHALVLRYLVLFELVNDVKSVQDSNEVDKLAVVFDTMVGGFNISLQSQLRVIFAILTLEEVLETSLACFKFVELGLVITTLLFGSNLLTHDVLTTNKTIKHALHIKLLSLKPDVSITVRIVNLVESVNNLLLRITDSGVSHSTFANITVAEVINGDVLILHEGIVHSKIVVLQLVVMANHFLHVLLCFLHHHVSFL